MTKRRRDLEINIRLEKFYKLQNEEKGYKLQPRKRMTPKRSQLSKQQAIVNIANYSEALAVCESNSKTTYEGFLYVGYSFHLFPQQDVFKTFIDSFLRVVSLGNNLPCKVEGIGNVFIQVFNKKHLNVE